MDDKYGPLKKEIPDKKLSRAEAIKRRLNKEKEKK